MQRGGSEEWIKMKRKRGQQGQQGQRGKQRQQRQQRKMIPDFVVTSLSSLSSLTSLPSLSSLSSLQSLYSRKPLAFGKRTTLPNATRLELDKARKQNIILDMDMLEKSIHKGLELLEH